VAALALKSPTMTYNGRQVIAQIGRFGREARVLKNTKGDANDFGNPEDNYERKQTVLAFKTYPNRNTEAETTAGDLARDRPVFMVPVGRDQPDPPTQHDRLVYDGDKYEVKSLTRWETHVEFFGEQVIHE